MILVPFDKYGHDPFIYGDSNYTSQRDRHIIKLVAYLTTRVEELITESNNKDQSINILGMQVSHLTSQMEEMATLIGEAASEKDFESLSAIERWLKKRETDERNHTTRRLP